MSKKRATFLIDEAKLEDFYAICYWGRMKQTDAIEKAFEEFIENWKSDKENKHYVAAGNIKKVPDK